MSFKFQQPNNTKIPTFNHAGKKCVFIVNLVLKLTGIHALIFIGIFYRDTGHLYRTLKK